MEQIKVWKDGGQVLIRSSYSPEYDLIVELWNNANESAWLISPDMPITDFELGRTLHIGSDDFPASILGEYGILSGNHGSAFARNLLVSDHGMDESWLGTIFNTADGTKYCLMEIPDKDHLMIHPLRTGDLTYPGFASYRGEELFLDGRMITVSEVSNIQLYPSNRIRRFEFLIDGKTPLPEKQLVSCRFLDHIINYDVVSPDALVDMVINNRGRKHFPKFSVSRAMVKLQEHEGDAAYDEYRSLPALLSYNVTMRHEGHGACVFYRHGEIHRKITWMNSMDIMWIWNGEFAEMPIQEFYIPKVTPILLPTADGRECLMDLANVARFDKNYPARYSITQKNCPDMKKQPDRFVRFSGREKRELGFAMGYSLISGLSNTPEWGRIRPDIYRFFPTWKMYPQAYRVESPAPGWSIDTVSYRQYFDPAAVPEATCCFWHHEYDDLIVYLDFHRDLHDHIIQLPAEVTGCIMETVEKTDSLSIAETAPLTKPQITLNISGGYGYLVLRFSPQKKQVSI